MTEVRVVDAVDEDVRAMVFRAFGDGRFGDDDWDHALGGAHVVAVEDGVVVAHAAVVPRTLWVGGDPVSTGYVEAVATAPEHERRGLGAAVMSQVADLVRRDYDLGALSTGRARGFYERLGWEVWRGGVYGASPRGCGRRRTSRAASSSCGTARAPASTWTRTSRATRAAGTTGEAPASRARTGRAYTAGEFVKRFTKSGARR